MVLPQQRIKFCYDSPGKLLGHAVIAGHALLREMGNVPCITQLVLFAYFSYRLSL